MTTRQQRRFAERKGERGPDAPAKPITFDALTSTTGLPDRVDPTDPKLWGGRLNIYVCEACRSHIVTRDVDEGVTPFMLSSAEYCPKGCVSEKPGGVHMSSSFYRVWDQRIREDYQWYAPGPEESAGLNPYHADHVERGGLLIRKAPEQ